MSPKCFLWDRTFAFESKSHTGTFAVVGGSGITSVMMKSKWCLSQTGQTLYIPMELSASELRVQQSWWKRNLLSHISRFSTKLFTTSHRIGEEKDSQIIATMDPSAKTRELREKIQWN